MCCCWKGFRRYYEDVGKERDCSDIIDEIYPEPGDPIVDKFGYGAFHNTNLDDLLKARHVESVLVTGTVTQICVEETARESFKRGYRTTTDLRRRVDLRARPAGRGASRISRTSSAGSRPPKKSSPSWKHAAAPDRGRKSAGGGRALSAAGVVGPSSCPPLEERRFR